MSLNLLSTPRRSDTPLGSISDVVAGLSQLPYKFRREDIPVQSSVDVGGGGYQRVVMPNGSGDYTSELNIGDTIYVYGDIIDIGITTIRSYEYVPASDACRIIINKVWTSNIGSGYINLLITRSDYSILLDPISVDTGESLLSRPEVYKPQQNGDLFLNISSLIAVVFQNEISINYQLRYQEYYNGIIQTSITDEPVFALVGRKQLLDVGGSNMWEFLSNEATPCKPMTKFKNPVTWLGWQTKTYYILDSNLVIRTGALTFSVVKYAVDVNKNEITNIASGHSLDLPAIINDIINEAIKVIPNAKYVEVVALKNGGAPLTQSVYYEIRKPCASPVMLEWVNGNGVLEQWLFEVNQDVSYIANEGTIYESPIVDTLDVVSDTLKRIPDGEVQYMTLTAEQLTADQILALKDIKQSIKVWVWLDNTGDKKIGVIVSETFNTNYSTKQRNGNFVVTIEFPRNFNYSL